MRPSLVTSLVRLTACPLRPCVTTFHAARGAPCGPARRGAVAEPCMRVERTLPDFRGAAAEPLPSVYRNGHPWCGSRPPAGVRKDGSGASTVDTPERSYAVVRRWAAAWSRAPAGAG